jgi:hypothetical protein
MPWQSLYNRTLCSCRLLHTTQACSTTFINITCIPMAYHTSTPPPQPAMLQPPIHTKGCTMATNSHPLLHLHPLLRLQKFPGLLLRYHVHNDITAIHCCHGPNRPWANPHSSLHQDSRLLQNRSYVVSTVPRIHSSAARAACTCTDTSVRYSVRRRHRAPLLRLGRSWWLDTHAWTHRC